MNKVSFKTPLQGQTDAMLLNLHRAKKFTNTNDPKTPNIPKFIATRGIRIRNSKFACYGCDKIFSNGWKYKTTNLGVISFCEQCKTKSGLLKKIDVMVGAIQGGSADGGR